MLPSKSILITVSDDGCLIDSHQASSLDEGVAWLAQEKSPSLSAIVLKSESKRLPSDHSLSLLCDLAVQRNVDLYGSWPISGGTLDLSSGHASAPGPQWSLLVRRQE
jgi:hypothetical protein